MPAGGRPSGICNGQACYTSGDIAAINAELANAEAEVTNDTAEYVDAVNQAAIKQAAMNTSIAARDGLLSEKATALSNACP